MRHARLVVAAFALLAPGLAVAAGAEVLSLGAGSLAAEMLGKTLGIARSLIPLALVIALVIEAFGGSPTEQKHYGALVARLVLVVALLGAYPKLFGTVINTAEHLATRIAPPDVWQQWQDRMKKDVEALTTPPRETTSSSPAGSEGQLQSEPGLFSGLQSASQHVAQYVGGMFFDSLIGLFVLLGQACQWVFSQLSRILLVLFYVIGPLALVWHIPAPSRTASKWFSAFVTIATWPVLSAILLAIATALMPRANEAMQTAQFSASFSAVCTALLMILLNAAVPFLASSIVGGSVGNVLGSSATSWAMGAMAGKALLSSMSAAAAGQGAMAGSSASGSAPPTTPGSGPTSSPAIAPLGVEPATPASHQGGGYAPGSPSVDPAPPEPSALASAPLPTSGSHDERRFFSTAPSSAPSSERSPAPERETQPGHPFNKAMDNGWGDIRYLEPIGPSTPSAPAEKAVTVRPSPIFQDTPPGRDTVS